MANANCWQNKDNSRLVSLIVRQDLQFSFVWNVFASQRTYRDMILRHR